MHTDRSWFESATLTDPLTGARPTWRTPEQPIYDRLRVEWPDLYASLTEPVIPAAGDDVVVGVVIEGPPTTPIPIRPATTAAKPRAPRKRRTA